MSIGFDPIVSSALFTASLLPHAVRPKARLEVPSRPSDNPPRVSVIVALYQEKPEDIEMTVQSLLVQTYPRDRFEVLFAVEAHDEPVHAHAQASICTLRTAGIASRLVVSHGGKRLKAYALNRAIDEADGEICAFYDASDDIEPAQLEKAAGLMQEHGYDAVQATVLRKGRSILSEFLFIDTAFWFRKYIPFVLGLAKGMPLSGEGLFVRRSVLNEVGGFPEVLTEDAYLGIILTERGKRFGLVSSVVTEKAPRNMRAHFVQRLRWNRGYITCLGHLLRSSMPLRTKCVLALPFLTPLSCSLAFVAWMLILGQWVASMLGGVAIPDISLSALQHPLYVQAMATWALLLFLVGIPLCVASYIRTLKGLDMRKSAPFVLLLPYYWTFIGFAATCSLFKNTTNWGKTER